MSSSSSSAQNDVQSSELANLYADSRTPSHEESTTTTAVTTVHNPMRAISDFAFVPAISNAIERKPATLESNQSAETTTTIHEAAKNGHKEVVLQLLLEKGANIESKDECGRTPLIVASQNGHKEVVQLLLEKGADIEVKDKNGKRVLDVCDSAMSDFIRCLPIFIENIIKEVHQASNIPSTTRDGNVLPETLAQATIESLYLLLQGHLAKAHADLILQELFMNTKEHMQTIATPEMQQEWNIVKLRFPMDSDDFIVETVSSLDVGYKTFSSKEIKSSSKYTQFFVTLWSKIHRDFFQVKELASNSKSFTIIPVIYDAITSNTMTLRNRIRSILLFTLGSPVILLYDLIFKPLYILATMNWVDMEWMLFRSEESMTFVRPYLVKCPYVSSPSFISLLLFIDKNTSDDKNLFALDFVKVSMLD